MDGCRLDRMESRRQLAPAVELGRVIGDVGARRRGGRVHDDEGKPLVTEALKGLARLWREDQDGPAEVGAAGQPHQLEQLGAPRGLLAAGEPFQQHRQLDVLGGGQVRK